MEEHIHADEEDLTTEWETHTEQQWSSCDSFESEYYHRGESFRGPQIGTEPFGRETPQETFHLPSKHENEYYMPPPNPLGFDGLPNIPGITTATSKANSPHDINPTGLGTPMSFGLSIPGIVNVEEESRERVHDEMERACEGTLSDKLTSDGSSSQEKAGFVPSQPILFPGPPRPVAISQSDRCVTPQMSNSQRQIQAPGTPGTPGNKTHASEIYHYTYEADARAPPTPVPAFVVVHSSGVARVTIKPTEGPPKGQNHGADGIAQSNRMLVRRCYVFVLAAALVLAVVTMAAGIVRSKELEERERAAAQAQQTQTPSTSPTSVPVLVGTPQPSPGSMTPSPNPYIAIPNDDVDLPPFPDLGDDVIGREETPNPTEMNQVPPTRPPRTRQPTLSPEPTLGPSAIPSIGNQTSSEPSEFPTLQITSSALPTIVPMQPSDTTISPTPTYPAIPSLPPSEMSDKEPLQANGTISPAATPAPSRMGLAPHSHSYPPTLYEYTSEPSTFPVQSTTDSPTSALSLSIDKEQSAAPSLEQDGDSHGTRGRLLAMIASVSPETNESIVNDPTSPQHLAFEWLVADQMEISPVLPAVRILQRFAMATFYYALGGDSWTSSTFWLSEHNECHWFSTSVAVICDVYGMLYSLQVENNHLRGALPPELKFLPISEFLFDHLFMNYMMVLTLALSLHYTKNGYFFAKMRSLELYQQKLGRWSILVSQ